MSFSSHNPPRLSLLGLPTELRLAIYDYVFASVEPRLCKKAGGQICVEAFGLSAYIDNSGQEYLRNYVFWLAGNANNPQETREHPTALPLLSLPYVNKQIREEISDILPELPPISMIRFVFDSCTKEDVQSFVEGIGQGNAKHIRKWMILGTAKCFHEGCQNGHLLKGRFGSRGGPCTFFTDGVHECNLGCKTREDMFKRGTCRREVLVDLDKREREGRDNLHDVTPQKTRWRVHNIRAEDRLEGVKSKLGHGRETAKKALHMYRHVVYSRRYAPSHESSDVRCYWGDPLDSLLNEEGNLEVNQQTFVDMVEAVMGRQEVTQ